MRRMLGVWAAAFIGSLIGLVLIALILSSSNIQDTTKIAILFGAILEAIFITLFFIPIGALHNN